MEPQNQQRYKEFQQTVSEMKQRESDLQRDIELVKQQLVNMELELNNLEQSITRHTGGMQTIKVLTENNIALVLSEVPLTLNANAVTQPVVQQAGVQAPPYQPPQPPQAAPQANYPQQPTQATSAPQLPINPQAQSSFAPPPIFEGLQNTE